MNSNHGYRTSNIEEGGNVHVDQAGPLRMKTPSNPHRSTEGIQARTTNSEYRTSKVGQNIA